MRKQNLTSVLRSRSREPRAEEPNLNCLLEPKPRLRITVPAPFYLPQTLFKNIMVAEEVVLNCYNFNPITRVKIGDFQGIL